MIINFEERRYSYNRQIIIMRKYKMEDCIFCKIIKGEIPSYTLYEDDIVKVFMDINPVADGHCMIVPKKHTENIETIDNDTLMHTEVITKKMYDILREKLGCTGLTRLQNNGYGQDVKHYHLHLIPRYSGDGLEVKHSELSKIEEIYNKF